MSAGGTLNLLLYVIIIIVVIIVIFVLLKFVIGLFAVLGMKNMAPVIEPVKNIFLTT